jgi:hypothetical protein
MYLYQIVLGVPVNREALVPVDKLGYGAINIHRCRCRGECLAVS